MTMDNTKNSTKITFEQYDIKYHVELPNGDISLPELLDIFKGILITSGYQVSSWENTIKQLASEYSRGSKISKEFDLLRYLNDNKGFETN